MLHAMSVSCYAFKQLLVVSLLPRNILMTFDFLECALHSEAPSELRTRF